ncbi:hypothetical protein QRO08_21970 [Paracidovorax citrulli]|uniref:Type III effector protein n=3 Tax=Paracidovorax citrulli TaxID=80869 RepID=A1TJQ4_PARC0|nr:hypothetical protein [Paracidovorax citrulli]ABM31192.1 hypothetical protein Aave_0588 [Paracidovorax citrulli AAC00-1]PVY65379.1 hypothetical protein C8E08_2742 [Paracidovorax citrulli]REG70439.1 hypothetical protein C8E07_3638 [Paracidovorax citrulli]RLJ94991.1 hypothetical protein C8E06_3633 [Paracidovorax citrulli]WIY28901.1 hypothetical protein QRO09_17840 [Paracidovorax citrulli]
MSDETAGGVVDEVMTYFQKYQKLRSNPAVSSDVAARMLPGALKMARRGLDAVPFLSFMQVNSVQGQRARQFLPQQLATLAGDLSDELLNAFYGENTGGKLQWRMDAAAADRRRMTPDFDRELNDYLRGLDGTLRQLEPCMDAMSVAIKSMGTMEEVKTDADMAGILKRAVVDLTEMRLNRIERHLEGIRLCLQRLYMEPELVGTPAGIALGALKTLTADHEEMLNALDVLLDARAPISPDKAAQLQRQLDALLGAARAFVEAAGAQFSSEGDDPYIPTVRLAPHILHSVARIAGEMEDALGAYKLPPSVVRHVQGTTYMGQAIGRHAAIRHPADSVESAGKMEVAPDRPAPVAPQRRKAQARSRVHRKAPQSDSGTSTSGTQDTACGALLQMARERLGAFNRPPQAGVTSLDDVVAVGASLRKDTSALQVYRNADSDPLEVGRQMRLALDSWFGHAGRWKGVQDQLQALQDSDGGALAKDLLRKIREERIEPLRQLHAQIDAVELDRVKTFAYPRLKHVEHLMQADPQGRILKVGAPVPLRSQGFDGRNRATLFEVALDVGTLANGQPAPPLYVHLHTRQPVTAETCRTIAFDDLDAVHVKNAEQRGKGRTWEVLNNALDSVHRGPLDAKVLEQLQQRMARD